MLDEEPDEQENLNEKEKLKLLGTRRGKLGVLTRKQNEIYRHIQADISKEDVEPLVRALQGYFEEFINLVPVDTSQ